MSGFIAVVIRIGQRNTREQIEREHVIGFGILNRLAGFGFLQTRMIRLYEKSRLDCEWSLASLTYCRVRE